MIRNRALCWLTIFAWSILLAAASGAEVRDAVCRVQNQVGPITSGGSGTLIEPSKVLTCYHVFRDGEGVVRCLWSDESHAAKVLERAPQKDLALLGLAEPSKHSPVSVGNTLPLRGQGLTLAGFGTDGKYRAINGALHGYGRSGAASVLIMAGSARLGDSGGPIYNASRELVGVLTATGGGETIATSLVEVRELLAGCPGGVCPVPRWHSPQPPKIVAPQRPPPPRRLVPIAPHRDKLQIAVLEQRIARLEVTIAGLEKKCDTPSAPGEPGPQGPAGPQGEQGPAGKDGKDAVVNLAALAKKLPPIHVQNLSPDGEVTDSLDVYLGGTLPLRLVPVGSK